MRATYHCRAIIDEKVVDNLVSLPFPANVNEIGSICV